MQLTNFKANSRAALFTILLSAMLVACSSGSGDGGASNIDGTVNGFHLVSSVDYNSFNQVTVRRTYTYDFDANRIDIERMQTENDNLGVFVEPAAREFYDDQGRQTLRETPEDVGVRTVTYIYKSAGLLESYEISGGSFDSTGDFEYDSSNNLIRVVENSPANSGDVDPRTSVRTYAYLFNSDGSLASTDYEQANFNLANIKEITDTSRVTYNYDSQGRRVSAESTNSDVVFGDSVTRRDYRYDSNGNVNERILTDSSGVYARSEYFYEASPEPIFNFWLRSFKYFP